MSGPPYNGATVRWCDVQACDRATASRYNGATVRWRLNTTVQPYDGATIRCAAVQRTTYHVRRMTVRPYTKVAHAESVVSKQLVAWHLVKTLREVV